MRAIIENWASVTSKLPNRIRPGNAKKMDQLESSSEIIFTSFGFIQLLGPRTGPGCQKSRERKGTSRTCVATQDDEFLLLPGEKNEAQEFEDYRCVSEDRGWSSDPNNTKAHAW